MRFPTYFNIITKHGRPSVRCNSRTRGYNRYSNTNGKMPTDLPPKSISRIVFVGKLIRRLYYNLHRYQYGHRGKTIYGG